MNPQIAFIHGTFWNLTALVDHHYRIYGADQLLEVDPSQFEGDFLNKILLKNQTMIQEKGLHGTPVLPFV